MKAPALAAGAVAVAVLAGACGGPAPARPATVATAAAGPTVAITSASVLTLLSDSWVTDGTRGYFVDNARDAADPPFDLYTTYWQLRLGQRAGTGTAGVQGSAVRAWIGRALAGDLATSSLPAIAQIDYASGILGMLNADVPAAGVTDAIEALRSGGQYRIDATAAPDWGATALAVGVLARIHVDVPAPVITAVRSTLGGGSPIGSLSEFISFAQVVGELEDVLSVPLTTREDLVSAAQATLSQASGTADAAWLAEADDLRAASRLLGVSAPAVSAPTCGRLVDASGGVSLPGQPGPDPQATFAALDVGCAHARALPAGAHGRAGWPTADAAADAVSATAAAARLAQETGVLGRFAGPLRREVTQVWVPVERQPAEQLAAQVTQADLRILAGLLGGATARAVAGALPSPAPPATGFGGSSDFAMLVYLIDLDYPSASSSGPAWARAKALAQAQAARGGTASMIHAAWLELAARMFAEPALHQHARAMVEAVRPSARAGSDLSGAAIGMWVDQASWPPATVWAEAGAAQGSLSGTVVLAAVDRRDFDDLFPLAL